jgi:O-acetyl-ADP-ribose deacetylase (regulator of RNase III)
VNQKRNAWERLQIVQGDLTQQNVDAIVNAANERMLGGGGVDGAIHAAAGAGLLEECRAVPEVRPGVRCPTGEARLTAGHNLPAKAIIHTVGPIWKGGHAGEPELLVACYANSLQLAVENGLVSVAFPSISCGVYGYPLEEAAAVAVKTVHQELQRHETLQEVRLVAFNEAMLSTLKEARSHLKHE